MALVVATRLVLDAYWRVFANKPVVIPTRRHKGAEWPPNLVVVVAVALRRLQEVFHFHHWPDPMSRMWSNLPHRPEFVGLLLACTNEWLRSATIPLWISKIDISLVRLLFASPKWPVHPPIRLVCAERTVPNGLGSKVNWMVSNSSCKRPFVETLPLYRLHSWEP